MKKYTLFLPIIFMIYLSYIFVIAQQKHFVGQINEYFSIYKINNTFLVSSYSLGPIERKFCAVITKRKYDEIIKQIDDNFVTTEFLFETNNLLKSEKCNSMIYIVPNFIGSNLIYANHQIYKVDSGKLVLTNIGILKELILKLTYKPLMTIYEINMMHKITNFFLICKIFLYNLFGMLY